MTIVANAAQFSCGFRVYNGSDKTFRIDAYLSGAWASQPPVGAILEPPLSGSARPDCRPFSRRATTCRNDGRGRPA
jgi:hypothetical protein